MIKIKKKKENIHLHFFLALRICLTKPINPPKTQQNEPTKRPIIIDPKSVAMIPEACDVSANP